MCGEQRLPGAHGAAPPGSPPRVRGTDFAGRELPVAERITPACAGNSFHPVIVVWTAEDHPRVCGEQDVLVRVLAGLQGSPPRVRGTALPCAVMAECGRITPACAGNSNVTRLCPSRFQDHPRVCGEQRTRRWWPPGPAGSPPRVRGTAYAANERYAVAGITPACAGNRMQYGSLP